MVEDIAIESIPQRPNHVSRADARAEKIRANAFAESLKAAGRASRWRCAGGSLFRERDGWFVHVLAWPGWGRGAAIQWSAKPMALDPLFWDIVGLPEHRRLPLSFRARGHWALHPLPSHCGIAPDLVAPDRLADRVVGWSDARLAAHGFASSVRALLDEQTAKSRSGHISATTVCLRILDGDFDGALRLCDAAGADPIGHMAGFGMLTEGGTMVTFIDQARAWILAHRPKARP